MTSPSDPFDGIEPPWRLMPLLALRVRAEEELRRELGRALAIQRDAEAAVLIQQKALEERERAMSRPEVATGSELAGAARFLDRVRHQVAAAIERSDEARAASARARERHLLARRAREGVQCQRERWVEELRRARDVRSEYELEDLAALGRRYAGES